MIIKNKKTKENDKQHYLKWQNVQYRQKAYQKKNAISGKQNPGVPVTAGLSVEQAEDSVWTAEKLPAWKETFGRTSRKRMSSRADTAE